MATSKEYMSYLSDQLAPLGGFTYRKMMGEYILYYHGRLAAYICDNRLLIKPSPTALALLPHAEYDSISEGGKKKLLRVDDIDSSAFLCELFSALTPELPEPTQKKITTKTGE